MTAKARGKNQIVLFDDAATERPDRARSTARDVRSIAHLKMLQSLAGKLNRLNDVRAIGETIANELRPLIDYHNCRVFVRRRRRARPDRVPRRARPTPRPQAPTSAGTRVGEGITGRVAATGESLLAGGRVEVRVRGARSRARTQIDESIIAVPLRYGARVIGVIVVSKLGLDQFDEDDVRLLEVLAGHASVALENARLYEAQRARGREREGAARVRPRARRRGRPRRRADARRRGRRAADRRAERARSGCRTPGGDLVGRAAVGYERRTHDRRRALRRRADRACVERPSRSWSRRAVRRLRRSARPARPARTWSRPFTIEGRWGAIAVALAGRRRRSATASCACSPASPTRRSSRSRTPPASRGSSARSSRPSRRSRTRSRRATSTRRHTPAGSPTRRCASARSSGSTATR